MIVVIQLWQNLKFDGLQLDKGLGSGKAETGSASSKRASNTDTRKWRTLKLSIAKLEGCFASELCLVQAQQRLVILKRSYEL